MEPVLAGHDRGRGRRSTTPRYLLSLTALVVVAAIALLAGNAGSASASTSFFCGGVIGGRADCEGAARTMTAEEAWGGTGGVCVMYTIEGSLVSGGCAGGASEHAYHSFGGAYYSSPGIFNQLATSNDVQGFAYEP